ncbi:MAG TPA: serine/threonine-protein kinase, partial [Gemmatimonadaceae bacterium]
MGTSDLRDQLQATLGDAYRIERELPGGGMSRVFVAEEARFHRRVVVKLLPPELAGGVSTERFRREIEMLGKMYHPRIVPILSMDEDGDLLYYTMPYVAGESLRDRLDREKQLPVDDAVRIAREIAEALGCAHRLGIIHRDVKPGNVLLADDSAVVTDFGIARAVERSAQRLSVTSSGFTLGTPTYMSPEQASGHRDLDARSDLYALGCVLYEMLAGEPPFTGPNPQAVIARHMSDTPRSIRLVRREVPEQLERLVMRLLAKSPADRYPTAERVVELLGHPDRMSVVTRRFLAVTPRRAARAGLVGAALVIVGATGLLTWTRARDGRA